MWKKKWEKETRHTSLKNIPRSEKAWQSHSWNMTLVRTVTRLGWAGLGGRAAVAEDEAWLALSPGEEKEKKKLKVEKAH